MNFASDCPLCNLVQGDFKTRIYWVDDISVCVDCLTCGIPMVVIKRHSAEMTEKELSHVMDKINLHFGDQIIKIRTFPRQIKDHAHYHVEVKDA